MEKVQTDDRLKELTEVLEAGVASVFISERWPIPRTIFALCSTMRLTVVFFVRPIGI